MIPIEVILLDPFGFFLFFTTWVLFVFLMIVFMKTPAWTFLTSKFIVLNPGDDKVLKFRRGKRTGNMIHSKKYGYTMLDSNEVYIEQKSKKPCTIAPEGFAIPINLKMAEIVGRLKELGIRNWQQLMGIFQRYQEILQKRLEKNPKENPSDADKYTINVAQSIPLSNVVDYFNRNERSDYIESEIQRRTATEIMSQIKGTSQTLKILLIVGIVAFIVIVGFSIAMTALEGRGGEEVIPISQVKEILQAPQIITGETSGTALE